MTLIYLSGQFVPAHKATVSVFDHGFLYGDGVFEGIPVYDGRIFRLDAHIRRLYESATTIQLPIPMDPDALGRAVVETVRRNGLQDAYIRLIVSRGPGDLGLDPRKCPRPTVVIIASAIQLFPEEVYARGMRAVTASVRKIGPDMLNPRVKSLNYLNHILARLEANRAGTHEAIMLSADGYVCEGTADNLFVVQRGELLTPPAYLGLLEGITRGAVLELARGLGLPAAERTFTLHDVYTAAECFLTGTAAEVAPVVEVDARPIGGGVPGPVTRRIVEAFRALVHSEGTPVYAGDQPGVAERRPRKRKIA